MECSASICVAMICVLDLLIAIADTTLVSTGKWGKLYHTVIQFTCFISSSVVGV